MITRITRSLANKIIIVAIFNTLLGIGIIIFAHQKLLETTQVSHTMALTQISSLAYQDSTKEYDSTKLKSLHEEYEKNLQNYYDFSIYFILIFLFSFLLFALYVRYLLAPLKILRKILHANSPEIKEHFPFNHRKDEIGLISSAFNAMQIRTLKFSQQQQNINENLAEKVAEKTEELRHQLYFDRLTQLPNREALIQSINKTQSGILLIINIDDFKEINDFFGHQAGDRLLIKFAIRLKSYLESYINLKLYRLNADEFSILYNINVNPQTLEKHVLELIHTIEKMHFLLEDNEVRIRVTIGASLEMDSPFEKADMALKKARQMKQSYLLYDEEHSIKKEYKENIERAIKIKNAISHNKIIPFYQPIFENKTGKIISYESLIRLQESDGTIIGPYHFLEIAKKTRLYPELTKIMIEKSCQHFSSLSTSFSVNLAFQDMTNPDITNFIKERIKHYGVQERIIFEILESEGIDNYEDVAIFIQEMHNLGCKIAIDDFGSGYSNYEHLLKLHIDYIKIDGSLIKNIDQDTNARIIVQTILDFAKKLGIETVAEFVHNQAILHDVKKLGIHRSQGFFLGEPQDHTL